jgi:hypothetical protein
MGWIRVTRERLCPCCQKADWCSISEDGSVIHCMRCSGGKPIESGGWIHPSGSAPQELPKSISTIDPPFIDWEERSWGFYRDPRAGAARRRLAERLGLLEQSLVDLRVGWGADRGGEFTSWPERAPDGLVSGIIRRYADGTKKMMKWGKHGLYFKDVRAGLVLCPEGGSDTAALLGIDCCAVGRPSNVGGIRLLAMALVGAAKVIILGERDAKPERRGQLPCCPVNCRGCAWCYPGLYGAMRTAALLARKLPRVLVLARMPAAKDAREWLNNNKADARAFLRSLEEI